MSKTIQNFSGEEKWLSGVLLNLYFIYTSASRSEFPKVVQQVSLLMWLLKGIRRTKFKLMKFSSNSQRNIINNVVLYYVVKWLKLKKEKVTVNDSFLTKVAMNVASRRHQVIIIKIAFV